MTRQPLSPLAFALLACAFACDSDDDGGIVTGDDPTGELTYVSPDPALLGDLNDATTFADDMHADHEGHPRGFSYVDVIDPLAWILNPRVNGDGLPPGDWSAIVPWGQVYADTTVAAAGDANPAGVRFQLRNMQQWILRKSTMRWERLSQTDALAGANYAEDFQEDLSVEADIRDESANGGGISATVVDGTNFHFFPADRSAIDPDDIAEVWSLFEGRLIGDEGTDPAAFADSRLIADVGGDYWTTVTAEWDQWKTNGDWAIGRFKYLTPDWQVFNAHTLTPGEMELSPFAGQ